MATCTYGVGAAQYIIKAAPKGLLAHKMSEKKQGN